MMDAGTYLRGNDHVKEVAAWNAGMISYFSGKPVVNLDGLVNDTVCKYVMEGRLVDYLREKRVRYILDFSPGDLDVDTARANGFSREEMSKLLIPIAAVTPRKRSSDQSDDVVTLYEVRYGPLSESTR